MTMIRLDTFKGEIPSYAANLLPDTAAVVAMDCHFDDGTLNPINEDFDTGDTVPINSKTLFMYEDQYLFTWANDVDVMKSPIARDPYRRVYWTDGDYPKVTYNTIFNGAGRLPATSYQLGIPAPENAPIVNSFTPAIDVESAVSIFYLITYVTGIGEEGQPSSVSARVECAPVGVELDPGTLRNITISYEGTEIRVVNNEGNAVLGFTYTKNVDVNGNGDGIITWSETAPADGNSLDVTCSQMDHVGVRSSSGFATIIVGPTPSGTGGANPPVPDAPIVEVTSDTDNDGIIIPSEISNGKINISITIDHAKLALGGYVSIAIANGGSTGEANPDALIVFVSPVKMTTTRLFDQMYIEIAAQFPDSVYVSGKAATEAVHGDPDFYVDDTHPSDNGLARLINYIMEAILPAPSKLLMTLDDFGGDTGPDPFNIVIGTGYYRYSDGLRINDEDTTNWRSIDKIAVEPNFTVKFDTGGNQALCAFFDVNGVYIKSIYATLHSGSGGAYYSTVIPANVYYLGLSFTEEGTTWDALNYNVDISYILESSSNLTQDEINAGNQITLGVG